MPSLRKGKEAWPTLLESLGQLYADGMEVDWAGFDAPYQRRLVALPTYAFQRQRYWVDVAQKGQGQEETDTGHPLLGTRLSMAGNAAVFEASLAGKYLDEHRVFGQPVLPATAYVELLLVAAEEAWGAGQYTLKSLVLEAPLLLMGQRVQVVATEGNELTVYSQAAGSGGWTVHGQGQVEAVQGRPEVAAFDLEAARGRCRTSIDVEGAYKQFEEAGLGYGPAFRGIRKLWRGQGEALAEVALGEAETQEAHRYRLHPALLDSALQVLGAAFGTEDSLPFEALGVRRAAAWSK